MTYPWILAPLISANDQAHNCKGLAVAVSFVAISRASAVRKGQKGRKAVCVLPPSTYAGTGRVIVSASTDWTCPLGRDEDELISPLTACLEWTELFLLEMSQVPSRSKRPQISRSWQGAVPCWVLTASYPCCVTIKPSVSSVWGPRTSL